MEAVATDYEDVRSDLVNAFQDFSEKNTKIFTTR